MLVLSGKRSSRISRPMGLLFSFSLTWYPMGAKASKRGYSLKSPFIFSKLLMSFLLSGPHVFWIFSSAWQCQQSSWNRNLSIPVRPSTVHPSVLQLSLNLMHRFLSKFGCFRPGTYAMTEFWFFFSFLFFFGGGGRFTTFFVFVNMGPYVSKDFKTFRVTPPTNRRRNFSQTSEISS